MDLERGGARPTSLSEDLTEHMSTAVHNVVCQPTVASSHKIYIKAWTTLTMSLDTGGSLLRAKAQPGSGDHLNQLQDTRPQPHDSHLHNFPLVPGPEAGNATDGAAGAGQVALHHCLILLYITVNLLTIPPPPARYPTQPYLSTRNVQRSSLDVDDALSMVSIKHIHAHNHT